MRRKSVVVKQQAGLWRRLYGYRLLLPMGGDEDNGGGFHADILRQTAKIGGHVIPFMRWIPLHKEARAAPMRDINGWHSTHRCSHCELKRRGRSAAFLYEAYA